VSAVIDDNGGRTNAPDVHLVLTNERGTVVDEAITNGAGRARFAFDPAKLGPPGRGELRAAFNGNADTAASVRVAEIERHTKVELTVPSAEADLLAPGSPEEGIAFTVVAKAPSGDVPNGSVEARVGGQLVGAGTIEHGEANVVVTFSSDEAEGARSAP